MKWAGLVLFREAPRDQELLGAVVFVKDDAGNVCGYYQAGPHRVGNPDPIAIEMLATSVGIANL
jgi:hypothetical protein